MRLIELPRATMFAVGHFDSLAGAIAATEDGAGRSAPASIEMIDRTILGLSRSKLEYRRLADMLEGDPEALLFVSFNGDSEAETRAKLDELAAAWSAHGHGYHTLRAETKADQDALTKVRKAGLGLLMAASEGASRPAAFVEDTAVAPERLGDYVARFREVLDRHELTRRLLRALLGRLPAHPPVRGPHAARRRGDDGRGRGRDRRARRGLRRRQLLRARRRPRALARSTRACSARSSTARCARSRRCSTRDGRLNPGVMVDAAPIDADLRDPALPPAPAAADAAVVRRARRDARAPPTAASGSAPAASPAAA